MMEQKQDRHIGRKIWYSIAILLSVLILLLSIVGLIGTWSVQRSLSNLTVTLLVAVENTAGGLQQATGRIDEGIVEVRGISEEVSDIASQISQNVENRGLVALLLPEEKEQQLEGAVRSIDETLSSIVDVITAGLTLYGSIDQLPFVDLPKPSQTELEAVQQSVQETQAEIDALLQSIQVFRTGVATEIDKITDAADRIAGEMDSLSRELAALDSDLAAVQDFADRMQSTVPVLFSLGAVLISVLLLYGGFTQVEMIRVYIVRWRDLEAGRANEEFAQVTGQAAETAEDKNGSDAEGPGDGEVA
jgi:hypothetical protein